MRELTLDDIDMDAENSDLALIENAIMHEIKTNGKNKFISKYSKLINNKKLTYGIIETNLIIALINIMADSLKLEGIKFDVEPLEKYIVDEATYEMLNDADETYETKINFINELRENSLQFFKERGFLYESVDGCVGWHI